MKRVGPEPSFPHLWNGITASTSRVQGGADEKSTQHSLPRASVLVLICSYSPGLSVACFLDFEIIMWRKHQGTPNPPLDIYPSLCRVLLIFILVGRSLENVILVSEPHFTYTIKVWMYSEKDLACWCLCDCILQSKVAYTYIYLNWYFPIKSRFKTCYQDVNVHIWVTFQKPDTDPMFLQLQNFPILLIVYKT